MKKTLISVLLIVSLLSTALFSVVFAAYTDSKTATGTATVSAFNVVITPTDNNITLTPADTTPKALASVTVTGTPDVAVTVAYTAELTLGDWSIDGDSNPETGEFYCPIAFTIGSKTIKMGSDLVETLDTDSDLKISTKAELIAAVEAELTLAATSVNAGTNLAGQYDKAVTVSWVSTDAAKDNALTSAATINLQITATITQQ